MGYALAAILGLGALAFGLRALAVLRRPPTGEAGRELVFLTARELAPALSIVGIVLVVEWVEWIVVGLNAMELLAFSTVRFYVDIGQGFMLFVAGAMVFRVLVPYTRARRSQHARVTLDRLAARVAMLKGRR